MVEPGGRGAGALARLRAARRRVALISAPQSRGARFATLAWLVALTLAVFTISLTAGASVAPALSLLLPLVLGAFLLDRPALRWLILVVAVAFVVEVANKGWHVIRPGSAVVLGVVALIAMEQARDRERLGLSAGRGELMLLELRDQLRRQGQLPALPRDWHVDVAQRSAGGASFGGDFLVTVLSDDGRRLELAIVDVSGKGVDAGTRALLLSGALGGLLGAVKDTAFLTAANDYLLRQEWDEGFATALHVVIDLVTGRYRLNNAGHLPAVHYAGGSGRWQTVDLEGSLLGVIPDATFGAAQGTLAPSDALLLYTDGLVEVPGRDLAVGIDRLLGLAERLIPRGGFAGGAEKLVEAVATTAADDRAVVLVWRR